MKEVTQKEFYRLMNTRDVTPHIISEWDNEIGFISEWRSPMGQIYGKCQTGNGIGENKKYWLK